MTQLPSFAELPFKPGNPPRSAWGLWGDDDQIGAINLLTPERVVAAARLVRKGAVFALNWELEKPNPPLFFRETLRHTIKNRRGNGHDDVYDNWNTPSPQTHNGRGAALSTFAAAQRRKAARCPRPLCA